MDKEESQKTLMLVVKLKRYLLEQIKEQEAIVKKEKYNPLNSLTLKNGTEIIQARGRLQAYKKIREKLDIYNDGSLQRKREEVEK